MPLTVPRIDDRRFDEILGEALARIPVHTPEWTNFNDSDPGVTLLQLFAYMTESMLYRSNLVPERNRLKFLQLLGVRLRPAAAAQGVATITNDRGPLRTVTLPPGVPVSAGRVGFVTTNGLDVLPIDARVYYRRTLAAAELGEVRRVYEQLFGSLTDDATTLEFYETTPFDPPTSAASIATLDLGGTQTVDHAAWIALLARRGDVPAETREQLAGKTITLGIMPVVNDNARVLRAGGAAASASTVPLEYALSRREADERGQLFRALEPRASGDPTDLLSLVQLTMPAAAADIAWPDDLDPTEEGVGDLPPALDDAEARARLLAWLRVRVAAPEGSAPAAGTRARFSWMGVNAVRVTQRVEVAAELVGTGSGTPDQGFTLANVPVLPESVRVTVGGELYARIDDLLAAAAEVPVRDPSLPPSSPTPPAGDPRVVVVDAESGQLRFGDGLRGKRPPRGHPIFASYAHGGGRVGNVGIGELKTGASLPAGFRVANPLPTWGGADGESVAEAERDIPRVLRHAQRAVTAADFRDIVAETPGVEVARTEVLPLHHPTAGSPAPGVVTVLVIPRDDAHPDAPTPDQLFLGAVCRHLDARRLLTTEVHVRGPDYVGITVSVGVDVVPGRDVATVREAVRDAVRSFLSPLAGGQQGAGWPLGTAVEDREVLVRAARVDGVAKVRDVRLWDMTGAARTTIEMRALELPRLDRVAIASGDAADLVPTAGGPPPQAPKRLPVPVIPREC